MDNRIVDHGRYDSAPSPWHFLCCGNRNTASTSDHANDENSDINVPTPTMQKESAAPHPVFPCSALARVSPRYFVLNISFFHMLALGSRHYLALALSSCIAVPCRALPCLVRYADLCGSVLWPVWRLMTRVV